MFFLYFAIDTFTRNSYNQKRRYCFFAPSLVEGLFRVMGEEKLKRILFFFENGIDFLKSR
jgi:hypothetical protein